MCGLYPFPGEGRGCDAAFTRLLLALVKICLRLICLQVLDEMRQEINALLLPVVRVDSNGVTRYNRPNEVTNA